MRRLLFITIAVLGAAGPLGGLAAPAAHAQAAGGALAASGALDFEEVGDRALDARDIAFDGAGTLWGIDSRLWRLPEGASTWEEVAQIISFYVLPLGSDTLLAGGNAVRRSLDGGQSWTTVHDEGRWLYEAPASGTLLTGTGVGSGVAYSHDRGATWQPGVLDAGPWVPRAEAFAELPPGHDHAGRLVAGCWGGLSYSDDDGVTWQRSSLWEDGGRYHVYSVAVGADGRIYAAFFELNVTGLQIAVSDDGGATYTVAHQFGELVGTHVRLFAFEGGPDPDVGVLVVVKHDGSVRRSDDGAATWEEVGQAPFEHPSYLSDALVGPAGHLYVSANRSGTERDWVYRTTEAVVVAAAAQVEVETETEPVVIHPLGSSFRFRVRLTNMTAAPLSVEAWSALEGPVSQEPVLGPVAMTLSPGQTVTRTLRQHVPGRAPEGVYTYAVRLGEYPQRVTASDAFTMVKEGTGPASRVFGAEHDAWSVSGWEDAAPDLVSAASHLEAAARALTVSPNPAWGTAAVTFALPAPAEVTVALYDALGRQVAVLARARFDAGRHEIPLDATRLPAGVYAVWVETSGTVQTTRVTLLR